MKKSKTPKKRGRHGRKWRNHGVRNKLESKVYDILEGLPEFDGYETESLDYTIPSSNHKYTPDFKVGDVYYETKGIWDSDDRKKMLLVRDQHPDKQFIMVFYNSNYKIYKGSKTTYAMWCDKHGIKWTTAKDLEEGTFKP